MFDDLKGKVVVVTGGVTGIGGAASLAFAGEGAHVFAQYFGGGQELADSPRYDPTWPTTKA